MRTLHSVLMTAAVSLGLAAAYSATQAVPVPNTAAPVVAGRYQLQLAPDKAGTTEFLVDTATGAVWSRSALSNEPWRKDGNPAAGDIQPEK